jgi:hypothetical protein
MLKLLLACCLQTSSPRLSSSSPRYDLFLSYARGAELTFWASMCV